MERSAAPTTAHRGFKNAFDFVSRHPAVDHILLKGGLNFSTAVKPPLQAQKHNEACYQEGAEYHVPFEYVGIEPGKKLVHGEPLCQIFGSLAYGIRLLIRVLNQFILSEIARSHGASGFGRRSAEIA